MMYATTSHIVVLPSSDSDLDDNEEEQQEANEVVQEQKVFAKPTKFLSTDTEESLPPVSLADVKIDIDQPILKCTLRKPQTESLWKPNVSKPEELRRKKLSMESSMEKERFLLRKLGQEERADFLYQQRGIIKKHILNAEEIIFDTDEDISCVRNFIEERYRLHFGLDRDGHPRELSEEEKKERDFLLDNSMFITRVILRMHNLEPDDYSKSSFDAAY
ncbi:unnamed protein product [Strongylus vulgaris]|uniref:Uncharacterized protein n=1 Tax=Strongylus vulgaris TaxID=40348 RepID=A0A3P7LNX7_STRVU|nr:unnamed protein product [Strongylus vulgaris]